MSKTEISNTPEQPKDPAQTTLRLESNRYEGPLPPSSEFARYERTLPGAADRIISMAENQQRHDHSIAVREQLFYYGAKYSAHGIVLGISYFAIHSGTELIIGGYNTIGIGIILASLTSFAGAIVYSRSK